VRLEALKLRPAERDHQIGGAHAWLLRDRFQRGVGVIDTAQAFRARPEPVYGVPQYLARVISGHWAEDDAIDAGRFIAAAQVTLELLR
jgi:hypothetical protein